jgi:hypothetical protein
MLSVLRRTLSPGFPAVLLAATAASGLYLKTRSRDYERLGAPPPKGWEAATPPTPEQPMEPPVVVDDLEAVLPTV